jgi:DNA-binding NtrC family response regulator
MPQQILVVDDEPGVRLALARVVGKMGYAVRTAADGVEAQDLLAAHPFDLVITDLRMPRADGHEVLRAATSRQPPLPVVVVTGYGTVSSAVEAMRAGAANFLSKPFNIEEVEGVVRGILAEPPARARRRSGRTPTPGAVFIGQDPKVLALLEVVKQVADTDSTVLVTGESGTGKEVLARAIHATSSRAAHPLVAVNCAAIPETLLESELFGHSRGAFTGATQSRIGRFAAADGGTLFLDEIGDLGPTLQAKLLRVIQDKEVTPLGETAPTKVDVRIVAATHCDLEARIRDGRFREDLYYRLSVIPLELPPLRERAGDIPALVRHLLTVHNARHGRRISGFDGPATERLQAYRWPGNVRELENLVERLVVTKGQGEIGIADLPPRVGGVRREPAAAEGPAQLPEAGIDLARALEEFEHRMIVQALERTGWNKNRAAALLGMNRTTLVEKLKKKGLLGGPTGAAG